MLGDMLRKLRNDLNLSQNSVAEKLNISAVTYNRYEKNQRSPDNATLIELADFYNVSIDYLLGHTNMVKSTPELYISNFEKQLLTYVEDLSKIEQDKLMEYIKFIKAQRFA